MWFSGSRRNCKEKIVVCKEKDFSSHMLRWYDLYFCFSCSVSVLSSFLFLQAAVPEESLAPCCESAYSLQLCWQRLRAAACSPKQSLLVALKVTWPDQTTSSSRLRSSQTIYPMHQPAAAAEVLSWWTFLNNPSSVQERALSTVLAADSPSSLDEEG